MRSKMRYRVQAERRKWGLRTERTGCTENEDDDESDDVNGDIVVALLGGLAGGFLLYFVFTSPPQLFQDKVCGYRRP